MAMKLVKKTAEYTVFQRGDGRYAVQGANRKPINGDQKVQILVAEDLLKVTLPAKPTVEAAVEGDSAEESEATSPEADAPAEEASE
ncbi:MAG: hypothetical protein R3E64_06890 [Halioglobus sp.]